MGAVDPGRAPGQGGRWCTFPVGQANGWAVGGGAVRAGVPVDVHLAGVEIRTASADRQAAHGVEVASAQRAKPGEQLVDVERLAEVVLGTRVEALHPVRRIGESGQDQYRCRDAAAPEPAGQIDPVDRRQPAV